MAANDSVLLQVDGDRLVPGDGTPVVLRGVGLGGWMNMENFITGYPSTESLQRKALRSALGEEGYRRFFDRFLRVFFDEDDAAYLAALGGADALVFTGGIGENSPEVRARVCEGLGWMGVELDPAANAAHTNRREGLVSREGSRLAVYVIPTDEELLIARDTVRLIRGVTQRF